MYFRLLFHSVRLVESLYVFVSRSHMYTIQNLISIYRHRKEWVERQHALCTVVSKCKHYASSVMMLINSCSLISPSWSRSNSSIIACL